jgi:trimeric autotransporter adhesin
MTIFRPTSLRLMRHILCLLVACCCAMRASAQCSRSWLPGDSGGEIQGMVNAFTTFDPDGAGPRPSLFIAGGYPTVAGYSYHKVMGFDGQRWVGVEGPNTLGGGAVNAFTTFNGQLIAGGNFNYMNGTVMFNIAAWNGTSWSPLGAGLDDTVRALAVYNGELYAAGSFTMSGSTSVPRIAKWNGSSWTSVGGGMSGSTTPVINTLLSFNGQLFAGGRFTQAGSTALTNLATWNGSTWSAFGNPNGIVRALASFSGVALNSNRVFIGGDFNSIGGIAAEKTAILRFDPINGNTWSAMGSPVNTSCNALFVRSTGSNSFQVNAVFSLGSSSSPHRWTGSGTTWTNLLGPSNALCLGSFNGQLMAGCANDIAQASSVLAYDNTSWQMLGQLRYPWPIQSMQWTGTELVASIRDTATSTYNTVQRRNPATGTWSDLPGTTISTGGTIYTLLALPSGQLIAGGTFTTLGSGANNIAQWNGANWLSMGSGFTHTTFTPAIYALARMPNDDIVAAGSFTNASGLGASNIARWHINVWTPMGGILGPVRALKLASNGDLYAGGEFSSASGSTVNKITRWDGVVWTPVGTGLTGTVYAIEQLLDGSIVASGALTTTFGTTAVTQVMRWNGSAWTPLGGTFFVGTSTPFFPGSISSLRTMPNGDLIAAGRFDSVSGLPVNNIARWNGASWLAMDEGIEMNTQTGSSGVVSLVLVPDGTLAVAGGFERAGAGISGNFAQWGIPATGCCDSLDFNNDTLTPDAGDLDDIVAVLAGGPSACSTFPAPGCNDVDFNNDEIFPDSTDLDAFLSRLAGGACL